EAHGGVHALATAHRGQRAAVTQMAENEAQRFYRGREQVCRAARGVLVADSMKTVTAHTFFQPTVRRGIDISRRLKRRMKRSIEYRNLADSVEQVVNSFDGFQLKAIVRGSKFGFPSDSSADFGI